MDKFTLNSSRKSKQKFRRKFPGVQDSHRNTIPNLVNKVRTTSMLTKRKQKNQHQILTVEKLCKIEAWHEHLPRVSRKCLAQEMGVSKGTPRTTTKSMKIDSYKTTVLHFTAT
jgi:uncharacterized UPF0160 family protein